MKRDLFTAAERPERSVATRDALPKGTKRIMMQNKSQFRWKQPVSHGQVGCVSRPRRETAGPGLNMRFTGAERPERTERARGAASNDTERIMIRNDPYFW